MGVHTRQTEGASPVYQLMDHSADNEAGTQARSAPKGAVGADGPAAAYQPACSKKTHACHTSSLTCSHIFSWS